MKRFLVIGKWLALVLGGVALFVAAARFRVAMVGAPSSPGPAAVLLEGEPVKGPSSVLPAQPARRPPRPAARRAGLESPGFLKLRPAGPSRNLWVPGRPGRFSRLLPSASSNQDFMLVRNGQILFDPRGRYAYSYATDPLSIRANYKQSSLFLMKWDLDAKAPVWLTRMNVCAPWRSARQAGIWSF